MVQMKEVAILAAIATLTSAQPSLYSRDAAAPALDTWYNPGAKITAKTDLWKAKFQKQEAKLKGLQGVNRKLSATDRKQDKENRRLSGMDRKQDYWGRKLFATDKAQDAANKKLMATDKAQDATNSRLRAELNKLKPAGKSALNRLAPKGPAAAKLPKRSIDEELYARDLYEREAYADAMPEPAFDDSEYVSSGLYARDLYERDLYERDLMERDLYEREAEADAYPEDYSPLGARDLDHINNILARDPDSLTERDIEVLASHLTDRDLHEIYARSAEPEPEEFEHELFAREADAEAEHELYAREAEAEAEAEAGKDSLNFERDIPVVDMVKRMLGYQRE